jgi:hypothetical protein
VKHGQHTCRVYFEYGAVIICVAALSGCAIEIARLIQNQTGVGT